MSVGHTLLLALMGVLAVMACVMSVVLNRVNDPAGSLGDKLTYRKFEPARGDGDGGGGWVDGDGGGGD
jgi:hypothetical protein